MANKLYEESDIQAIANAIRAKGQTGTMKVSQMAGKIAGIPMPSGTKTITANGTYDVTEYASASVAVPTGSLNSKRFTFTLDSDYTGKSIAKTILSGDPDVSAHWNDNSMIVSIVSDSNLGTGPYMIVGGVKANHILTDNKYSLFVRYNSSGSAITYHVSVKPLSDSTNDCIRVDSSGNVWLCTGIFGTYDNGLWKAGNYIVTVSW